MAHKELKKHAKSTQGTKVAAEMRSVANKLNDEQRDESMSFAMQVIYSKDKPDSRVAVRH